MNSHSNHRPADKATRVERMSTGLDTAIRSLSLHHISELPGSSACYACLQRFRAYEHHLLSALADMEH